MGCNRLGDPVKMTQPVRRDHEDLVRFSSGPKRRPRCRRLCWTTWASAPVGSSSTSPGDAAPTATQAVKVLEEQYTLAKKETLVFERNWYGVRGLAEFVLKNYKHTYVDAVNLHTLKLELDAIKDTLKGDPEYEDLAGVITALGLVAHPDKARTVSSTAAACFLEGVIAMIATREEEKLTWTKTCGNGRHPPYGVRDHIYKVRQWTRANGMEKPSHHAADATERSLGKFLNKWKIPSAEYYGGACTDLKSCDVVMRDVPWWPAFVGFGERNKNDWKKLNAQLLEGYAYKDEPPFEGQKPISGARGNRSVYVKLHDFVNYGRSAEADVETALSGLPRFARIGTERSTQRRADSASTSANSTTTDRRAPTRCLTTPPAMCRWMTPPSRTTPRTATTARTTTSRRRCRERVWGRVFFSDGTLYTRG